MLNLICNLNPGGEVTRKLEIQAGDSFEMDLMVEADPNSKKPVSFDTIILEILYNDQNYVLTTDPRARPIPTGFASKGAVDAFNRYPIKEGTPSDKAGPYTEGTLLTLRPANGDPSGPYKNATGRAGYRSTNGPFQVKAGRVTSVMGGKAFALAESNLGTSNLIVVGHVYNGSEPVATRSLVSTVNVVPRTSKEPLPSSVPTPMADHGWVP